MKLYVIHVARTRMVVSGIDELSREETPKGVIEGKGILSFFIFHVSAMSRSSFLLERICSWWSEGNARRGKTRLSHLLPEDWFECVFDKVNVL